MHTLAESLLRTIRRRESIRAGDRVAAAVSGGADSVGLLGLLVELREELGIVLSVAHVNHKLRGEESDEDERFVANLAREHGLELHRCDAPIEAKSGAEAGSGALSGVEAAARELRYKFFRRLAREGRVDKIATAHTLDDQAETLLLRIFRGTGIRGLAAIHPRIAFEEEGRGFGEVIRPLLGVRRAEVLEFLRERGQSWREDSSNRDVSFLRNRLRHKLLPLLREEFGEAAIEHMSELAEIARAEEEHWERGHPEIGEFIGASGEPGRVASLHVDRLMALPLAAQRRLVRAWLEANAPELGISFRLIEETIELARGPAGAKLELGAGLSWRRGRQELSLEKAIGGASDEPIKMNEPGDYEYILAVPGVVQIRERRVRIEACVVDVSEVGEDQREQLMDAEKIPKQVVIRNWRAGDRYWPAHTAAPRKVKELLSDRHATGAEKKLWPVAVAEGGEIVWMSGFAVPSAFRARDGATEAIWIREIAGMM
ncbi:MAG: tRNA lysidine(34) synthetase TilS [Terriglobales bacterium]